MNLLLASLKINFDVIGVSETWNSFDNPIRTNVQMTGYEIFLTNLIVRMGVLHSM